MQRLPCRARGSRRRYVEPFLTAPSPGIIASIVQNEHYDSFESYLDALSAALQVEYETIVRHGFLLQLDCPDLALERHTSYQDRPLGEFVGFVELVVAAINKALRNIPRIACGCTSAGASYEGPHDCDVPLDDILPAILKTNVGCLVLPFANPRHEHEYRLLGQLADDQLIVAGVIDTQTNFVEHPEVIADRLERIAGASATLAVCWPEPIVGSTPTPEWVGSRKMSFGRSCGD